MMCNVIEYVVAECEAWLYFDEERLRSDDEEKERKNERTRGRKT